MKTSYVKMIDVWLFATLCVPFIEVLISTWMEVLKDEVRKEDNRVNNIRKVAPFVDTTLDEVRLHGCFISMFRKMNGNIFILGFYDENEIKSTF